MNLSELQTLFWRAARGEIAPEALDEHFVGRKSRTGAGRMRIYNGAYFARLEAALADTFPSTLTLLGDARFQELARRYVVRFPAQERSLERVGAHFARMLRLTVPESEAVLAEVAELEYARVAALLAPHDEALSGPLALSASDLTTVSFHWVRSLTLHQVRVEAFRLWQEPKRAGGEGPDAQASLTVAIWRRGFSVHHRTLDESESLTLKDATRGIHLIALCEQLSEFDDAVPRAFSQIRRWLSAGWIARIDANQTDSHGESEHAD